MKSPPDMTADKMEIVSTFEYVTLKFPRLINSASFPGGKFESIIINRPRLVGSESISKSIDCFPTAIYCLIVFAGFIVFFLQDDILDSPTKDMTELKNAINSVEHGITAWILNFEKV